MSKISNTNKPSSNQSDEIEIGQLFQMIGRAINNFFKGIGNFFKGIGNFFISFLLLIRKKIIYFITGSLIGGGIGIYMWSNQGYKPLYKSSMIVESRIFPSGYQLYENIDYLNSLTDSTNSENQNILADILHVSLEEASLIEGFSVAPIKSNFDILFLYKKEVIAKDTYYKNIVKFREFESSLNKEQYPKQKLTIYARKRNVFSTLGAPIIKLLNAHNSDYLKAQKTSAIKNIDVNTKYLIRTIDSINAALPKYLTKESSNITSFYFEKEKENESKNNSLLDQYNSILENLNDLNNEKPYYTNIFNVVKSLSPFGEKANPSIINFTIIGICIGFLFTLVIFLLIKFNRYLSYIEQKRKIND